MTNNTPALDPVRAVALLDEPTRRRIYEVVAVSHEPVGRDDTAVELGISRELAAFHLDRLVSGGLLKTEYRRRSGRSGPGAGRPAKLYRRTDRELTVSIPPRHYDAAADVFAEGLSRLQDPAATAAVAEVARERGTELGVEARRMPVGGRVARDSWRPCWTSWAEPDTNRRSMRRLARCASGAAHITPSLTTIAN